MKVKILLVDDDIKNSLLLKQFLEVEGGFEVVYAKNGLEGWNEYNQSSFNLIVLDINMPEMDGFELAERIRAIDNHTLIFFLSDRTEKTDRLKGFQIKANDYIPKPFFPEELIAKIQERFSDGTDENKPNVMLIGAMEFNVDLCEVHYQNTVKHLSYRQAKILQILDSHIGAVVDHDTILFSVWGDNSYANHLALNVQITYLRNILKFYPMIQIVSIKRKGYSLKIQK
jgi:Response regulators consisting of a CheY-like receiver domain and a winged-helix DNA-binding domain